MQGVIDAIEGVFPSLQSQLVGTVAVVVVLFLVGEIVRRLGPELKARFSDVAVETVQATLMTVLSVVAAGVMIVIWRATPQVLLIMDVLDFTRTDAIKLVLSIALLAGSYTLTRGTKRAIRRLAQERGAISEHQQEISHHLVQIGVIFVTLLAILSLWRIPVGNLLLGAGFLGVILGFAARQTLGSVLAGFVVLFSRPFELGDWIEIGEYEGVVQDISIVNTQIKTYDDEIVMIPNDIVTSQEVVNRSRSGRYRINLDVGVDYDTDIDHAANIAEDALAEAELPLDKPTPHVILTEFGGSAIILRLRFWISNPTSGRRWRAKTEVIERTKTAFEQEGIKIPFPQRELMARQEAGGFRLSGDLDPDELAAFATADGDERADEEQPDEQSDEEQPDEQPEEKQPDEQANEDEPDS